MKSRKSLEIDLLYSEEPEAFEAGYNDCFYKKDYDKSFEGMAALAYEAGWNKATDDEEEFYVGY